MAYKIRNSNGISKVSLARPSYRGKFLDRRTDFDIPTQAEDRQHENLIRIDGESN